MAKSTKQQQQPQTRLVEYKDDGLEVCLTVQRADVATGIYRSMLMERVKEEAKRPEVDDLRGQGVFVEHTLIYPSLIAAVSEATGFDNWPIPFDEYIGLPEPLAIAWERAVFELNPHWVVKPPDGEAQKKATATSSE